MQQKMILKEYTFLLESKTYLAFLKTRLVNNLNVNNLNNINDDSSKLINLVIYKFFYIRKFYKQKWSSKTSNALAAIFKNVDFS